LAVAEQLQILYRGVRNMQHRIGQKSIPTAPGITKDRGIFCWVTIGGMEVIGTSFTYSYFGN